MVVRPPTGGHYLQHRFVRLIFLELFYELLHYFFLSNQVFVEHKMANATSPRDTSSIERQETATYNHYFKSASEPFSDHTQRRHQGPTACTTMTYRSAGEPAGKPAKPLRSCHVGEALYPRSHPWPVTFFMRHS